MPVTPGVTSGLLIGHGNQREPLGTRVHHHCTSDTRRIKRHCPRNQLINSGDSRTSNCGSPCSTCCEPIYQCSKTCLRRDRALVIRDQYHSASSDSEKS